MHVGHRLPRRLSVLHRKRQRAGTVVRLERSADAPGGAPHVGDLVGGEVGEAGARGDGAHEDVACWRWWVFGRVLAFGGGLKGAAEGFF